MRYYYSTDRVQVVGPLEFREIQALICAGLITSDTPMLGEGRDVWSTAAELGVVPAPLAARPRRLAKTVAYRDLNAVTVFQALSLTLYFVAYLLPCYARDMEAITRRPRVSFPAACLWGLLTLGGFSNVMLVIYAFELEAVGRERHTPGRQALLGWQVLGLIVVSFFVGFITSGLALVIGVGLCTYAVYIFQKEINLYSSPNPEA